MNMNVYSMRTKRWNAIETSNDSLYTFDEDSTYIQNPPFFEGFIN